MVDDREEVGSGKEEVFCDTCAYEINRKKEEAAAKRRRQIVRQKRHVLEQAGIQCDTIGDAVKRAQVLAGLQEERQNEIQGEA